MPQTQRVQGVATSIWHNGGITGVSYRGTTVVWFNTTHIILNSNGWKTNTTKLRMNQTSNQFGLGFRVFQNDWSWYVQLPSGEVVNYQDGMEIVR